MRTQNINLTGTKVRNFLEIRKFLDKKKSLESDYFQGSFYAAFESVFRCFKRCFFADKLLFKSRFVFDGKIHVSFLKSVANRFAVITIQQRPPDDYYITKRTISQESKGQIQQQR